MERLQNLIQENWPHMVELRRYFHMYPELSGQEFNTQRKITAELRSLGLEPRDAAGTGVIADICGKADGPMLAIRADIDALPLQDELDQPYRSQNHGACHACGHDGHTAMLLGTAAVLTQLRESLSGTVRLIFQPSEERFPGGAAAMVEAGALAGAAVIIGAHLWQPLPTGTVGIRGGRLMASPDEFIITVSGRGGHGSMPHQTVDALLTGAQLAAALHTIVSRSIDPMQPAALSLGVFKAGEAFNIIPDTAVLKGTVRTFDQSLRTLIFERIETISRGVCLAAGAEYHIERRYGFPPLLNDPAVAAILSGAAHQTAGVETVIEPEPVMVGEDFSVYLERVPGCFAFIGCGNATAGSVYPHHHPRFDLDEQALKHGAELFCRTALQLLAGERQ
ncbi:MAG: amidohydrolase [Sporomusaceae bacterium]|nr:amidohydrolase [Sporomusaceae bacterium]